MNVIFLIARDSIRALLHQRLLIALMLVSLAATIFFSIVMKETRENITGHFEDSDIENNSSTTHVVAFSSGGVKFDHSGVQTNSSLYQNMSESDRKKMNETMEQGVSAIEGFFYAASSFGGSLVSLLIFSTAVTSEIRRETIRLTLSKPVSRIQYLLGKYLGGVVVMAGYAIIASLAMLLFSASSHVEISPVMKYAPWLMFCRQLMLGSLAMLLSLFMHPAISCALAFFAGNGFYSTSNPLYYLLPGYKPFNIFEQIIKGDMMSRNDVLLLSLYALDFVMLMLLLAWWRFQRKEVC